MFRLIRSINYFVFQFFKKREYDIIFYYPQHFNRGKNGVNEFFEHYYKLCKKNKLSFLILDEPYPNSKENKMVVPFDFVYYVILLLRKLFKHKNFIEKDKYIGVLLSKTIFKNIQYNNFIVLSKSMLSVFSGINPSSRIFDNQHGIIYSNKSDYVIKNKVSKHLVENKVRLLLFGNAYKRILIEEDDSNFMENYCKVIGKPQKREINKQLKFNNRVLITLQFTHDHSDDENKVLKEKLTSFITSSSANTKIDFYLKHHPRFNNEVDLTDLFALKNVNLAPEDIEECFNLCSLHVTAYSTSTFEAARLGIPTIFINPFKSHNYFERDFSYPLNLRISDLEDDKVFSTSSKKIIKWASAYYESFNANTFLKLIQ